MDEPEAEGSTPSSQFGNRSAGGPEPGAQLDAALEGRRAFAAPVPVLRGSTLTCCRHSTAKPGARRAPVRPVRAAFPSRGLCALSVKRCSCSLSPSSYLLKASAEAFLKSLLFATEKIRAFIISGAVVITFLVKAGVEISQ